MYMDRDQKDSRERRIEYLELKYDTDVQSGLKFAQVRHRQHVQRVRKTTKEKKQIWLQCFQQEWRDLLFFFFVYLSIAGRIFSFSDRLRILLFSGTVFLSAIKMRRVFRYRKVLSKQKEIYEQKVTVLREGTFQRIRENGLVKGDIVRLKRGQSVPADVVSLENPHTSYLQGELFTENTGRGIITKERKLQSSSPENKDQAKRRDDFISQNAQNQNTQRQNMQSHNLMIQELFIREGIYFPQELKDSRSEYAMPGKEERRILVICFEEMYFPSRLQIKKFHIFIQQLKKTGVELFFFTSQNKESAYLIGKQIGIVKEQREVIDHQQFLLLQNTALEKQLKSIKIYCGLSEKEKEQVIIKWKKQIEVSQNAESNFMEQGTGQILVMSNQHRTVKKQWSRPVTEQGEGRKESCVYACCSIGNEESDIYFKKCWRDGILQYLIGKRRCQKFFLTMQKTETLFLGGFCVFMFASFMLSFFIPQQGNMQWIMQTGSLLCAIYIIGKEMAKEVFRCWFLQKIKRKK